MRLSFAILGLAALAACGEPQGPAPERSPANATAEEGIESSGGEVATFGNGVQLVESEGSVLESVQRLEQALDEGDFTIFARVDHQMNASQAERDLRPAVTIIFGNPEIGTYLIENSPEAALDLPQRMAVYEQADGQVMIAYNSPLWLASRHNISGEDGRLEQIGQALEGLAMAAAGKAGGTAPASSGDAMEGTD